MPADRSGGGLRRGARAGSPLLRGQDHASSVEATEKIEERDSFGGVERGQDGRPSRRGVGVEPVDAGEKRVDHGRRHRRDEDHLHVYRRILFRGGRPVSGLAGDQRRLSTGPSTGMVESQTRGPDRAVRLRGSRIPRRIRRWPRSGDSRTGRRRRRRPGTGWRAKPDSGPGFRHPGQQEALPFRLIPWRPPWSLSSTAAGGSWRLESALHSASRRRSQRSRRSPWPPGGWGMGGSLS